MSEFGAAWGRFAAGLDHVTGAAHAELDALDHWERLRPLMRAELAVEGLFRGMHDLTRRQGDITMRAKSEFCARGMLGGWTTAPAAPLAAGS